eukprot:2025795-Amphidinium_carterae.1
MCLLSVFHSLNFYHAAFAISTQAQARPSVHHLLAMVKRQFILCSASSGDSREFKKIKAKAVRLAFLQPSKEPLEISAAACFLSMPHKAATGTSKMVVELIEDAGQTPTKLTLLGDGHLQSMHSVDFGDVVRIAGVGGVSLIAGETSFIHVEVLAEETAGIVATPSPVQLYALADVKPVSKASIAVQMVDVRGLQTNQKVVDSVGGSGTVLLSAQTTPKKELPQNKKKQMNNCRKDLQLGQTAKPNIEQLVYMRNQTKLIEPDCQNTKRKPHKIDTSR